MSQPFLLQISNKFVLLLTSTITQYLSTGLQQCCPVYFVPWLYFACFIDFLEDCWCPFLLLFRVVESELGVSQGLFLSMLPIWDFFPVLSSAFISLLIQFHLINAEIILCWGAPFLILEDSWEYRYRRQGTGIRINEWKMVTVTWARQTELSIGF